MEVLGHPADFIPIYTQLKTDPTNNKMILEAIDDVKRQLKGSQRPLGIHHKYDNIPKTYKKKYNLQTLYHFEMPGDYRLTYTVRKSFKGTGVDALILELLTHDEYNKLFGYFKKKSY